MDRRILETWASLATDNLDRARPLLAKAVDSLAACQQAAEALYRAVDLLRTIAEEHRATAALAAAKADAASLEAHELAIGSSNDQPPIKS